MDAPDQSRIAQLLAANRRYVATRGEVPAQAEPGRRLAVVTCMDARIDPYAALGLNLGDAHVIRNAGGRVTDDVLRSTALSTHALGVDTVVVMHHTRCALAGASDADLRATTGAEVDFHPIDDHETALRHDVERLAATPFLTPIEVIAGLLYDVDTGSVVQVVDWHRDMSIEV